MVVNEYVHVLITFQYKDGLTQCEQTVTTVGRRINSHASNGKEHQNSQHITAYSNVHITGMNKYCSG